MRIDDLLAAQAAIEARVRAASATLKAIPGVGMSEMGLTPDAVKQSPEYQEASRRYRMAFEALRAFNKRHLKEIKALTKRGIK